MVRRVSSRAILTHMRNPILKAVLGLVGVRAGDRARAACEGKANGNLMANSQTLRILIRSEQSH
jgi:hypothetical protein